MFLGIHCANTEALKDTSNLFVMALFNAICGQIADNSAKAIMNKVDANSIIKQMESSTRLFLSSSNNFQNIILNQFVAEQVRLLKLRIYNFLLEMLLRGNLGISSRANFVLFDGPPGVGKSVIARELLDYMQKTSYKMLETKIPTDVNSNMKDYIVKARSRAKKNTLIIPLIVSGAFFAQYEETNALRFMQLLVKYIIKLVQSGFIVFLVFEEIDALLGKNNDSRFLAYSLSQFEAIKNSLTEQQKLGKCGAFCLIGNTNHSSSIKETAGRRFEVISLPLASDDEQVFIFLNYMKIYQKKMKHQINEYEIRKILKLLDGKINFCGADIENIISRTFTEWELILMYQKEFNELSQYKTDVMPLSFFLQRVLFEIVKKMRVYYQFTQKEIDNKTKIYANAFGIKGFSVSDDSGLNEPIDK